MISRAAHDVRSVVISAVTLEAALHRASTRRLVVDGAGFAASEPAGRIDRPEGAPYAIFAVCVGGLGALEVHGLTHRVTEGRGFFTYPNEPHSYWSCGGLWKLWWCTFRGTDIEALANEILGRANAPVFSLSSSADIIESIGQIINLYDRDDLPARLTEAAGIGWKLLTKAVVESRYPAPRDPVSRALAYLSAHMTRPLRVRELVAVTGLSRSRLMARFKETTGISLFSYRDQLRMAKARRLLLGDTLSIGEIAARVGYADPYHFSRQFRKQNGLSPRAFRRKMQPLEPFR